MRVQTPITALMTMISSFFFIQQNSASEPNIDYCSSCGKLSPHEFERIMGGENALPNEFAFYAKLNIRESDGEDALCGGTLISSEVIITAAHCINGAKSVEAVLGEHYRTTATKIVVHPNYSTENGSSYDVGLIRVDRIHFTDTINPSCIPLDNSKTYAGLSSIAIGYGSTQYNGYTSTKLKKAKMHILSNEKCDDEWDNGPSISNDKICAKHVANSVCQGDSGGALIVKEKRGGKLRRVVVGITSYAGPGCLGNPNVFTRVACVRDWILEEVHDAQCI